MRVPSENNLKILVTLVVFSAACGTLHAQKFQWLKGSWVPVSKAPEGTPAAQLVAIRQLVEQQKYPEAIKRVEALVKAHPTDAACEEAMLLAGESELARGRYYQAFEWLDKVAVRFPSGKLLERALDREFIAAEALLAGKKRVAWGGLARLPAKQEGLDILTKITEHAPATRIARKALLRIADYHFDAGEWPAATDTYDLYVKQYKNDPETSYAMLQGCRATHAQFAGVEYDDTPLIEAEQRYKAFAQRFPQAAKEAGVSATLKEIADARGKKLFESGDFYKRTGKLSAAAYYYQQVVQQYPGTLWADRARQAMGLMGDVPPDVPAGQVVSAPQGPEPARPKAPRSTDIRTARINRSPETKPVENDNRFLPPGPPSEEGMLPTTDAGKVKEPR